MVRRWLSQIELFLLSKLGSHTVIKIVKHCNHGCWDKCSNYIENRNTNHILSEQIRTRNFLQAIHHVNILWTIRELIIYMP